MDPSWFGYSPYQLIPKNQLLALRNLLLLWFPGGLGLLRIFENTRRRRKISPPKLDSWIWMNFYHKSTTKLDLKNAEMLRHVFKSMSFLFKSYILEDFRYLWHHYDCILFPAKSMQNRHVLSIWYFQFPFSRSAKGSKWCPIYPVIIHYWHLASGWELICESSNT